MPGVFYWMRLGGFGDGQKSFTKIANPKIEVLPEGSRRSRQRHALLDAVMWMRGAWYILLRHLVGTVANRRPDYMFSYNLIVAITCAWRGAAAGDFKDANNDFE